MSEIRKMPERWWIDVCPECNGEVGEMSQTHTGTCPRSGPFGSVFIPRPVPVMPVAEHDAFLRGPVHGTIQTIRGMCSDERPWEEIDAKLRELDELVYPLTDQPEDR